MGRSGSGTSMESMRTATTTPLRTRRPRVTHTTTLMHPQVVLAWELNDAPIPPQHGAPLRLIVPFRYGARSLKAIQEIQFTATTFTPPKPWPT